jgi:hypothetical protein
MWINNASPMKSMKLQTCNLFTQVWINLWITQESVNCKKLLSKPLTSNSLDMFGFPQVVHRFVHI